MRRLARLIALFPGFYDRRLDDPYVGKTQGGEIGTRFLRGRGAAPEQEGGDKHRRRKKTEIVSTEGTDGGNGFLEGGHVCGGLGDGWNG